VSIAFVRMGDSVGERKPQTRKRKVKRAKVCPVCDVEFRYPSELEIHFRRRHSDRRCLFSDCSYKGANSSSMLLHYEQNHHNMSLDEKCTNVAFKRYFTLAGTILHISKAENKKLEDLEEKNYQRCGHNKECENLLESDSFLCMRSRFDRSRVEDPRTSLLAGLAS
jgi:hypothetical protein